MKKSLGLFMLVFVYVFGQAQVSKLNWQKAPIETDGKNNDWMERPGLLDAETGVLYEAYNDSNTLYVLYEIPNEQTQMKAMTSGFSIEVGVKSKPKVHALITLPVLEGKNMQERPEKGDKQGEDNRKQNSSGQKNKPNFKNDYLLMSTYADVSGFIDNPTVIKRSDSPTGFTYNVGWDKKNAMLCEFRIPLQYLFDHNYDMSKIIKSQITIKTIFEGIERSERGGGQGPGGMSAGGGGGMQGGGGGGRSGGGPPGGMSNQGGGMSDMQDMSQTKYFKYKFTLKETSN